MDKNTYQVLKWTAIVLTLAWVGWSAYDAFLKPGNPGDHVALEADNLFKDGTYARALAKYDEALTINPGSLYALRGKARTLLKLGRLQEALIAFDTAIAAQPDFAPSYANRGILHDRMGHYRKAIADYERALKMDATLGDGPNWITRFLRKQPTKPPGIGERAAYLRAELAKPAAQRLLRVPEIDAQQRDYQQ